MLVVPRNHEAVVRTLNNKEARRRFLSFFSLKRLDSGPVTINYPFGENIPQKHDNIPHISFACTFLCFPIPTRRESSADIYKSSNSFVFTRQQQGREMSESHSYCWLLLILDIGKTLYSHRLCWFCCPI